MTHSDNDGLIVPPNVAPVKAVILPLGAEEAKVTELYEPKAQELAATLNDILGKRSVKVDTNYHMRPADRFFYHLQRGVPLRIELGEKEYSKESVRLVRRDTGERFDVSWDRAPEVVKETLEAIQANLYKRAKDFRESNTHFVESFDEFKKVLAEKGGFIKAYFAGSKEDERAIKEETMATVRCFPLDEEHARGKCFYTGKEGARLAIFAKAY
jgi:prolyl-tRNA synthetase